MTVHGIVKTFGDQQVLADVSFELAPGEILGLIGANGAGKTTLLECVAGLLSTDAGEVRWRGSPLPSPRRKERLFYVPEFILPYLRSTLTVIALFLITRLLLAQTLNGTATAPPPMPYQRGQFWIRRFRAQAETLCAALAALTKPTPASDFVHRALAMLESTGWIAAHRFLFAGVRCHLLGWPRGLAPDGRRAAFSTAAASA